MHETNKSMAAIRHSKAAANQVYGLTQYEDRGPFPLNFTLVATNTLQIQFDRQFIYKGHENNTGNHYQNGARIHHYLAHQCLARQCLAHKKLSKPIL